MKKNVLKRSALVLFGLIQGTLGSYWALLGVAFGFPESEPGSKDYEEDRFVAPIGFIMLFIWLAVMAAAVIKLRKNIKDLLSFLIPWVIGTGALVYFAFYVM